MHDSKATSIELHAEWLDLLPSVDTSVAAWGYGQAQRKLCICVSAHVATREVSNCTELPADVLA